MLSCKISKIYKEHLFYRTPPMNASEPTSILLRNSRSQLFFKLDVLNNFAYFTGKHLCWSLFLLKRDSDTGVILWNLRNFKDYFFYETPPWLFLSINKLLYLSRRYFQRPIWISKKRKYILKQELQILNKENALV